MYVSCLRPYTRIEARKCIFMICLILIKALISVNTRELHRVGDGEAQRVPFLTRPTSSFQGRRGLQGSSVLHHVHSKESIGHRPGLTSTT